MKRNYNCDIRGSIKDIPLTRKQLTLAREESCLPGSAKLGRARRASIECQRVRAGRLFEHCKMLGIEDEGM